MIRDDEIRDRAEAPIKKERHDEDVQAWSVVASCTPRTPNLQTSDQSERKACSATIVAQNPACSTLLLSFGDPRLSRTALRFRVT
jgi:hypothetical protein